MANLHLPNTLFVVFGATGDLARNKLLPALKALKKHNRESSFFIIGVARDTTHTAVLQDPIYTEIKDFFIYQQLNFDTYDQYVTLHETIEKVQKEKSIHNKIIYCATASKFYGIISSFCAKSGIMQKGKNSFGGTDSIVYEKPFGIDEKSAYDINVCVEQLFNESQIYRVDHYLTKSLITSFLVLRFGNTLFKSVWNAQAIDRVEILFHETAGIMGRGEIYDSFGVLKDVVQNHVLQLLALVALDEPTTFTDETVTQAKITALQNTSFVQGFLGQYAQYTEVPGVALHSQTPTYAYLEFAINTPTWKNIPFIVTAGKKLPQKTTEIRIIFKQNDTPIFGTQITEPNKLVFHITPQAGFSVYLYAQKSEKYTAHQIELAYCPSCNIGTIHDQTYEVLLHHLIMGDKKIAVSYQEIQTAWQLIDHIIAQQLPLHIYQQGKDPMKLV